MGANIPQDPDQVPDEEDQNEDDRTRRDTRLLEKLHPWIERIEQGYLFGERTSTDVAKTLGTIAEITEGESLPDSLGHLEGKKKRKQFDELTKAGLFESRSMVLERILTRYAAGKVFSWRLSDLGILEPRQALPWNSMRAYLAYGCYQHDKDNTGPGPAHAQDYADPKSQKIFEEYCLKIARKQITRHIQNTWESEYRHVYGHPRLRFTREIVALLLDINWKSASSEEKAEVETQYQAYAIGKGRGGKAGKPKIVYQKTVAAILEIDEATTSQSDQQLLQAKLYKVRALGPRRPLPVDPPLPRDDDDEDQSFANLPVDDALVHLGKPTVRIHLEAMKRITDRPVETLVDWLRARGSLVLLNEPGLPIRQTSTDSQVGFGMTREQLRKVLLNLQEAQPVPKPNDDAPVEQSVIWADWIDHPLNQVHKDGEYTRWNRGMHILRKILYTAGALGPITSLLHAKNLATVASLFDQEYSPYSKKIAGADKTEERLMLATIAAYRFGRTGVGLLERSPYGMAAILTCVDLLPQAADAGGTVPDQFAGLKDSGPSILLHEIEQRVSARLGRRHPDCVLQDECTVEPSHILTKPTTTPKGGGK